ncbi:MAG: hypothetical protein AAGC44_09140 [Planctomycetota bacterium]
MSIIGTGIAAGVANTANQAQQAGRADNARSAAQAERSAQTDKLTLTQLHGTGSARDTDEDLPDQQAPGYEDLYQEGDGEERPAQPAPPEQPYDGDAPNEEDQAQSSAKIDIPPRLTYTKHHGLEAQAPLSRQIDVTG